jgi:hypothetical protein
MIKHIKALDSREFEEAESNGSVYGQYKLDKKWIYVYVELGTEGEYREHFKDDPKTQYRFFRKCVIYYSETLEQLENANVQYENRDKDIILYW